MSVPQIAKAVNNYHVLNTLLLGNNFNTLMWLEFTLNLCKHEKHEEIVAIIEGFPNMPPHLTPVQKLLFALAKYYHFQGDWETFSAKLEEMGYDHQLITYIGNYLTSHSNIDSNYNYLKKRHQKQSQLPQRAI